MMLVFRTGSSRYSPSLPCLGALKVLNTHTLSVLPSGTTLDILRHREPERPPKPDLSTWVRSMDPGQKLFARCCPRPGRFIPERARAAAGGKAEVEAVAPDFCKPSSILLSGTTTETHFKQLLLGRGNALHLALHSYGGSRLPGPCSSCLCAEQGGADDGLL